MPENPRARRLAPPTPEYFPTLGKQFYPNNTLFFLNDYLSIANYPNNYIIFQCDIIFILTQFDPNDFILLQFDPLYPFYYNLI